MLPPGSSSQGLRINSRLLLPLAEIGLRRSRSSGPGGQHANVTESRVEAVFEVEASATLSDEQKRRIVAKLGPVVTAAAQDERSQLRNRELALARLATKLRAALVQPKSRRPTVVSRAAKKRRVESKQRQSEKKQRRRRPSDESS